MDKKIVLHWLWSDRFLQILLICWWNKLTYNVNRTQDKQAGSSCLCGVILLGTRIFLAFSVHIGHCPAGKMGHEATDRSLNSFLLPYGNTMT